MIPRLGWLSISENKSMNLLCSKNKAVIIFLQLSISRWRIKLVVDSSDCVKIYQSEKTRKSEFWALSSEFLNYIILINPKRSTWANGIPVDLKIACKKKQVFLIRFHFLSILKWLRESLLMFIIFILWSDLERCPCFQTAEWKSTLPLVAETVLPSERVVWPMPWSFHYHIPYW